jgi:hypothetical protein
MNERNDDRAGRASRLLQGRPVMTTKRKKPKPKTCALCEMVFGEGHPAEQLFCGTCEPAGLKRMNVKLHVRVDMLEDQARESWKWHERQLQEERARIAGLDGYREGYKAGHDRAWLENLVDKDKQGVRTVSGKLDALLMLAHPDKHGGSPLANEITRWLIELRTAARSRAA